MPPVIILHEAEIELVEAAEYYEERSPCLGVDLLQEVKLAIDIIQQAPHRWPLRGEGTRKYLLPRFPYQIVYLN